MNRTVSCTTYVEGSFVRVALRILPKAGCTALTKRVVPTVRVSATARGASSTTQF